MNSPVNYIDLVEAIDEYTQNTTERLRLKRIISRDYYLLNGEHESVKDHFDTTIIRSASVHAEE